jgi:hypothetical protein
MWLVETAREYRAERHWLFHEMSDGRYSMAQTHLTVLCSHLELHYDLASEMKAIELEDLLGALEWSL